jgi:hypothetical protein
MRSILTVYDETAIGERVHSLTLDFLTDRISVRELIRRRVYEEVREYNATTPEYFRGLVQPTDAERALDGFKLQERRKIDWEEQYQRAVEAFQRNGFFILLDDRQAESLDQEFDLKIGTEVSFVKLMPLVGG